MNLPPPPAETVALLEELEREDLLAFALGQHREEVEIVDLADWIHTAVAGKKKQERRVILPSGEMVQEPAWQRPPMLTLLVPEEVVAMIHGEPKDRDCLLLVHIKREVLDSWLAQQALAAGVQ
jgi:hypothetical protein